MNENIDIIFENEFKLLIEKIDISNFINLKPNIKLFNDLNVNNLPLKKMCYISLEKNDIIISIFNQNNVNKLKTFFIDISHKLGGYSVNENEDKLILKWPIITKEREIAQQKILNEKKNYFIDELRKIRVNLKKKFIDNISIKDTSARKKNELLLENSFNKYKKIIEKNFS